jgi:hypothetical protein
MTQAVSDLRGALLLWIGFDAIGHQRAGALGVSLCCRQR